MASETILKQKEARVKELAEQFEAAKVVLLTDYRGINVADDTKLRAEIRKSGAKYTIIKNNYIKRALDLNGESELDSLLEGPTAVVIGNDDYLEPAKAIYNFAKANEYYKIKGGIIEGKVVTAEEIITLAKLPSKETLLSMLAGGLLATVSKFAVALDQVRLQKEAQA